MHEPIKVTDLHYGVLLPREAHRLYPRVPPEDWALILGRNAVHGTRDEIVEKLDAVRKEIDEYFTAEHANTYHLRTPERHCPDCAPGEMACPQCNNVERNGWAIRDRGRPLPEDSVRCGNRRCRTIWQPFER